MSEAELTGTDERGMTKRLCFSVILPLDILLLFFLEAREHLNKNELITGSDINEAKHKRPHYRLLAWSFDISLYYLCKISVANKI